MYGGGTRDILVVVQVSLEPKEMLLVRVIESRQCHSDCVSITDKDLFFMAPRLTIPILQV